jgi:hypothetical protein
MADDWSFADLIQRADSALSIQTDLTGARLAEGRIAEGRNDPVDQSSADLSVRLADALRDLTVYSRQAPPLEQPRARNLVLQIHNPLLGMYDAIATSMDALEQLTEPRLEAVLRIGLNRMIQQRDRIRVEIQMESDAQVSEDGTDDDDDDEMEDVSPPDVSVLLQQIATEDIETEDIQYSRHLLNEAARNVIRNITTIGDYVGDISFAERQRDNQSLSLGRRQSSVQNLISLRTGHQDALSQLEDRMGTFDEIAAAGRLPGRDSDYMFNNERLYRELFELLREVKWEYGPRLHYATEYEEELVHSGRQRGSRDLTETPEQVYDAMRPLMNRIRELTTQLGLDEIASDEDDNDTDDSDSTVVYEPPYDDPIEPNNEFIIRDPQFGRTIRSVPHRMDHGYRDRVRNIPVIAWLRQFLREQPDHPTEPVYPVAADRQTFEVNMYNDPARLGCILNQCLNGNPVQDHVGVDPISDIRDVVMLFEVNAQGQLQRTICMPKYLFIRSFREHDRYFAYWTLKDGKTSFLPDGMNGMADLNNIVCRIETYTSGPRTVLVQSLPEMRNQLSVILEHTGNQNVSGFKLQPVDENGEVEYTQMEGDELITRRYELKPGKVLIGNLRSNILEVSTPHGASQILDNEDGTFRIGQSDAQTVYNITPITNEQMLAFINDMGCRYQWQNDVLQPVWDQQDDEILTGDETESPRSPRSPPLSFSFDDPPAAKRQRRGDFQSRKVRSFLGRQF